MRCGCSDIGRTFPTPDMVCGRCLCACLQLRAERKVEALEAALARIEAAEGASLDELMASRCL